MAAFVAGSTMPLSFAFEENATSANATSTPTPVIISTEGSISFLELDSQSPSMRLDSPDGHSWILEIDRATTTIWKKGRALSLRELKVGDRVKARHLTRKGKKIVKSIEVL